MTTPSPRPQRRPRTFYEITNLDVPEHLLDFVVPDLHEDTSVGLCITLRFGRNHPNVHAREMYRVGTEFYALVADIAEQAARGVPGAEQGLAALISLPERQELRYGYVRGGHRGNGMGAGDVSTLVRGFLKRYASIRAALREHPDALGMLPLVGMDRISDSHGCVVGLPLIAFTQEMAAKWEFPKECMREVVLPNVWDPGTKRFGSVRAVLPVDDAGQPILLVPRKLVASSAPLSGGGYFDDLGGGDTAVTIGGRPRPRPPRSGRTKAAALRHAESNPQQLVDYVDARLNAVRPRRHIRKQLGD